MQAVKVLATLQATMSLLKQISRRIRCLTGGDHVICDGRTIPAKHLRFGGANFAKDDVFVRTGETEALRLQRECGLNANTHLLEIGCGTGRLPIGITGAIGDIASYCGVDVSEAAVDWCKRHIETPTMKFIRTNAQNARYNPSGKEHGDKLRLPFGAESFDIIYLYSVFSHLTEEDVIDYLAEFARVLSREGAVFLTAFTEDNVPQYEENPANYKQEWKGALHCVRFEKEHFETLCRNAGLQTASHSYGTETDGQSAYVLKHIKN